MDLSAAYAGTIVCLRSSFKENEASVCSVPLLDLALSFPAEESLMAAGTCFTGIYELTPS